MESEVAAVSAELKPGERKVISNGTEGPVVEIIKRGGTEDASADTVEVPETVDEEQINNTEDSSKTETAGE